MGPRLIYTKNYASETQNITPTILSWNSTSVHFSQSSSTTFNPLHSGNLHQNGKTYGVIFSFKTDLPYITLTLLSAYHKYISSNYLKGYPHSMMRRAYLRIKFSSLKMKRDRVLEAPMPGRLMLLALLATFRRLFSWLPSRGPSSPPPESADSPAILQKEWKILLLILTYFVSSQFNVCVQY